MSAFIVMLSTVVSVVAVSVVSAAPAGEFMMKTMTIECGNGLGSHRGNHAERSTSMASTAVAVVMVMLAVITVTACEPRSDPVPSAPITTERESCRGEKPGICPE